MVDNDNTDITPVKGRGKQREDAPREFGNITYCSADLKASNLTAFCKRYSGDGHFATFPRLLQRFVSQHQGDIGQKIVVNEATMVSTVSAYTSWSGRSSILHHVSDS